MTDDGTQDWQLLEQFVRAGSQEAFAELLRRHVNLVWSTCFRDLHDRHLAEDATQAVFLILAKKARTLGRNTVLAGWLFRTARWVARNALKEDARRKNRERRAADVAKQNASSEAKWEDLSPVLHEILDELSRKDRDAILLHCLQGKTLAEVGAALGTTEDAARMRVHRALDKARTRAARRGLLVGGSALGVILTTHGVQAAPAMCVSTTLALVGGSAGSAATLGGGAAVLANGAMKAMFMLKLKIAGTVLAGCVLIPTAGVLTYEALAAPPAAEKAAADPGKDDQELTLTQVCQFKVENGQLKMSTEVPFDVPPPRNVKVAVKGLLGETRMMLGTPQILGLRLTNHVTERDGQEATHEIRSPMGYLRVTRSVQPQGGEAYAVMLTQVYRDLETNLNGQAFNLKAGEVLLTIQRKGALAKEDQHTAKDFSTLALEQPVEYWRYVGPFFRQFAATDLYPLPAALTREVLVEPEVVKAAAELKPQVEKLVRTLDAERWDQREAARVQLRALGAAALEILRTMDKSKLSAEQQTSIGALVEVPTMPHAQILQLRQEVGFLLDAMESDELKVRTAALAQLRKVTGQRLTVDVEAPAEQRAAVIEGLRHELPAAASRPAK